MRATTTRGRMTRQTGSGFPVLILLCWFPLAYCQNTTATRSQDQLVGWQAEDGRRGTWSLVTNCLTTIFACTWSVQHLNVPGPFSSDGKWYRLARSVKWMTITIFFPEFMILHALFELMIAIEALQEMAKKKTRSVKLPWWLSLSRGRGSGTDPEAQVTNNKTEGPSWTLAHCFLANMGGIRYQRLGASFPLTAFQIANTQHGLFNQPEMTEDDIGERTKQDWFIKLLATLQFLQLALSLIVRTSQGLDFSQLETITVGFAVCGVLIYLLYFSKPQGLQACFVTSVRLSGQDLLFQKTYDGFWDVLRNKRQADKTDRSSPTIVERIPNDNIPISQNQWAHPGIFLLALTSALFGALHAIAWNFEFPTLPEKILWHVATIVSAASPVAGLLLIPVAQLTVSSGDPHVFLTNCLRLVREASWHLRDMKDKQAAQQVYKRLEAIYAKKDTSCEDAQVYYQEIFSGDEATAQLPHKVMELFNMTGDAEKTGDREKTPVLVNFPKAFASEFCSLVRLMDEKESKKLNATAKTNVFPRKIWLPGWINHLLLYFTSALYVMARVCILAVGFSSLRQMPASVYDNTPWTVYIPSVGSG
ncbi:hypothetical protein PG985_008090 [Apiospora marii]|uniref:uncharacterized protein n=1 Tax=Apiospora marii TaxID=335849 RepID=UPI00312F3417